MIPDFGDVPSWIAAVATSGALVATARLLYIERNRRRDEELVARRRQASNVTHWLERGVGGALTLRLSNSSSSPVYHATFRLLLDSVETSLLEMAVIPPGVDGGGHDLDLWIGQHMDLIADETAIRIELFFVDSDGGKWLRDLNGKLLDLGNAER